MIVFFSICSLIVVLICQGTPLQYSLDVISPLLTALACVRNTQEGLIWIICMALLWAVFLGVPWTLIACVWAVAYYSVRFIARRIEWQRGDIHCALTIFVSLSWHIALILFVLITGREIGITWRSIMYLIASAFSAGIISALFSSYLLRAHPSHSIHMRHVS